MNELIALEKIAQWEKLKALVLDSVSSPITKRVYNMALDEFMAWFQQARRPGFTKATVSAWRVSLEERRLGSSSIIIRMSAIRKLAAEAADNGLLAPELAQGISRVKSVKSTGIRVGNWLSLRQAQALLSAPDIMTVAGLRDRAILAVLLGCGLRRSEVAALTFGHVQQRDGRWCVVDLVGKVVCRTSGGEIRKIPLGPVSVTQFFGDFTKALASLGLSVKIDTMPVEVANPIRCDIDTVHCSYDSDAVTRFFHTLRIADAPLKRFSTDFYGKISPVHFFWGSFDLAVTRFNGKRAPARPGADAVQNRNRRAVPFPTS
jgi:Family of unknown function (DUF5996)/Phage integrase, N-terminal SAM-like domain